MSSTQRGYNRHKSDYYITPKKDIKEFLGAWLHDLEKENHWLADRPDKAIWFDPCAGGDAKHGMSYPDVLRKEFQPIVLTNDIREDSPASIHEDFILMDLPAKPHVIITNPPFNIAEPIIVHALDCGQDDGFVVMLLRLNFMGSKSRQPFFEKYMPEYIYVHPRRMSFTADNKTDSIEYAHFVWRKGHNPRHAKLTFVE